MTNQAYAIEEITTHSALEALTTEWSALWERCPSATPFQSPEWLLTWWKYFGNNSLFTLAVRNEGRLVGLAPLFIFTHQAYGFTQVSLLGSGISDYLDFLIEPASETPVVQLIFTHLLTQKAQWDICDFQELRQKSPLLSFASLPKLHTNIAPMEICPVLVLPDTPKEFLAGLSAHFRKRLRYTGNCLARAGELHTELAARDTLPEYIEALFTLHRTAWEERNMQGVLADPKLQGFHREIAENFLKRGWLRLRVLRLDGRITAVLYSFASRGRFYCYLSGFDPAIADLSPGKYILWLALEGAFQEGIKEFDFLRGGEEYKYMWNPQNRTNYRMRAWHSSLARFTNHPGISRAVQARHTHA